MAFLRLGVECAVLDDDGRVLLSRRGDLNVWTLPGGRLDAGEWLDEAAAREVYEETGVICQIERPVGLYYWRGWKRLNVLYAGWPLGGELRSRTFETRANVYFDTRHLPDDLNWEWRLFDALSDIRPEPRVIETPSDELRRVKRQLRRRWVKNLLMGKPEPRFPRFDVRAVGVVWDEAHLRVLTLPEKHGHRLPQVRCNGQRAPWEELSAVVREASGVEPIFQWAGIWQDASHHRIDFVFAATVEETETSEASEWMMARTAGLGDRDADYVERVKADYASAPVWSVRAIPDEVVRIEAQYRRADG